MKKINKDNLIIAICSIVLVWLLLSVVDINMHNLSDCKYSWWNIFKLFLENRGVSVWN